MFYSDFFLVKGMKTIYGWKILLLRMFTYWFHGKWFRFVLVIENLL